MVFFSIKIVSAKSGFGSQFGGRIIDAEAREIQELEWSGYTCDVFGSTIEIRPISSIKLMPTSYFIPLSTRSKTGYGLRGGQLILGKYSGKTMITCTLPEDPPDIKTVSLNTITLFGTSR